jgi:hypothetical protein
MKNRKPRAVADSKVVYQLRVSIAWISPEIWRRIVVPESYTFWDLHVAIQDSMGWLDCHLHEFTVPGAGKDRIRIGIPSHEDDPDPLPGWEVPIAEHFDRPGRLIWYIYDFGDDWYHQIVLEGILLADSSTKYPACIAGERACPPEDCGGLPGYEHLLDVLADAKHEEHKEMIAWLKGHARNYHPYKPSEFNADKVRFSDSKKRLKSLLRGG